MKLYSLTKKRGNTNMTRNIWTNTRKYEHKYKYLSHTVPKVLGCKTGGWQIFEFDILAHEGSEEGLS